jgi:hypothetical protein
LALLLKIFWTIFMVAINSTSASSQTQHANLFTLHDDVNGSGVHKASRECATVLLASGRCLCDMPLSANLKEALVLTSDISGKTVRNAISNEKPQPAAALVQPFSLSMVGKDKAGTNQLWSMLEQINQRATTAVRTEGSKASPQTSQELMDLISGFKSRAGI